MPFQTQIEKGIFWECKMGNSDHIKVYKNPKELFSHQWLPRKTRSSNNSIFQRWGRERWPNVKLQIYSTRVFQEITRIYSKILKQSVPPLLFFFFFLTHLHPSMWYLQADVSWLCLCFDSAWDHVVMFTESQNF